MRTSFYLLFLFLVACAPAAPVSTVTPTITFPTSLPTIASTATPDIIALISDDLQEIGLNVAHDASLERWAV